MAYNRKLITVLYADVVDYTGLTARDLEGTDRALRGEFERFRNTVDDFAGRVVEIEGDAILCEFPVVSSAVDCAAVLQNVSGDANENNRADKHGIRFRIGINLGEVLIDGDRIIGDGVNICERIQHLADADGICISGSVYDSLTDTAAAEFYFTGEHNLKNVARPTRVYAFKDKLKGSRARLNFRSFKTHSLAKPLLAILILAALALAFFKPFSSTGTVGSEQDNPEDIALQPPDKIALAVLPFSNMTSESELESFTDGITDDLITHLAQSTKWSVIASNSSFVYKQKAVDVRQAAQELGVNYLIEGGMQTGGDQVRINVQLIDGEDGAHLWAQRFLHPSSLFDDFEQRDAFIERIARSVRTRLERNPGCGNTDDDVAQQKYIDALVSYRQQTVAGYQHALGLLEDTLRRDPSFSRARELLASIHWRSYSDGLVCRMSKTGCDTFVDVQIAAVTTFNEAQRHAELASACGNIFERVQSGRALYERRYDDAIKHARRAIEKEKRDPETYISMARALIFSSRASKALSFLHAAQNLNPQNAYIFERALALFSVEKYKQALDVLKTGRRECGQGKYCDVHVLLVRAAVLAQLDLVDQARCELYLYNRALIETYKLPEYSQHFGRFSEDWPYEDAADSNRLLSALIKAGLRRSYEIDGGRPPGRDHCSADLIEFYSRQKT